MSKRVLSLGQCAADNYTITQFLEGSFDAEVVPVDTFAEANARLGDADFALILVNRLLDVNGASGLDFISQLKGPVPVMLVSNYADAQQQAVMRGAVAGFGKAHLHEAQTLERLQAVLGVANA